MGVAKGDTRSYTVALMGTSMRDFAKKLDPVIHVYIRGCQHRGLLWGAQYNVASHS